MKISKHFTTSALTAGLFIALLGSVWLYAAWTEWDLRIITTFAGLLFLTLLLGTDRTTWFWSGFFIGMLWFWWIGVSFYYYHLSWLIPIAVLGVALIYGFIFWIIAYLAEKIPFYFSSFVFHLSSKNKPDGVQLHTLREPKLLTSHFSLLTLTLRSLALLSISYLHPLGFDWFKPELIFVHSYLGVAKWQFALILAAIVITIWRRQPLFLLISILAYSSVHVERYATDPSHTFKLITTHTTIADKWNPDKIPEHIDQALKNMDQAIQQGYSTIIFPESVFPFFLNRRPDTLGALMTRSQHIDIIIGALYFDGTTHRNSTYLFHRGRYIVANKVVLVPFGEANPLPEFASRWVNQIFFDGAIDYTASTQPTDWNIQGKSYRNAICYEATSETLYADHPRHMIVTSNNAWFVPSIEPTFQRLLLEYYVRKYGTTIYHATNMSPAYVLRRKH